MKLTLEGQEAMLYFLDPGESICGNYLESREICLFSPLVYLSNHLLTVWIHGCLSYALVYNPILLYLFSAQIAPALAIRSAFGLASVYSGHTHLVFGGLACFLTMQDAPSSSGVSFATVLDQLFLLGRLQTRMCTLCAHISIFMLSLSLSACVCVFM